MNFTTIANVLKFLGKYKHGDIIYPSAIRRKFNMNEIEVDIILTACEKRKLIEHKFRTRCPVCQHLTGEYYNSHSDIPDYITCEHCDEEIEKDVFAVDAVEVVYMVK